ncbi:MAG: alpha/beta hydrolase [Pseudomonadota bacterium]
MRAGRVALDMPRRMIFIQGMLLRAVLLVVSLLVLLQPAHALEFGPLKDRLFAYAALLESSPDGGFRRFEYDEIRDVNGRDRDPGRRALSKYVLRVPGGVKQRRIETPAGRIPYMQAGRDAGRATMLMVYIHGNGGNLKQGVDTRTFGGNFGRVMSLVVKAGGRYVSPGFSDFGATGAAQIGALLADQRRANPGAKIVLSCGSQGSLLCWRLAREPATTGLVDGLVLLGGTGDSDYQRARRARRVALIPIVFAHGSRDIVFDWQNVRRQADALRAAGGRVRMDLFDTGIHGTPIRMIDWRDTLNWML